jgi:hypothetical protein
MWLCNLDAGGLLFFFLLPLNSVWALSGVFVSLKGDDEFYI